MCDRWCDDTNWTDSVPHSDASVAQHFHEAAHYTHIVSPAWTAAHLPGTAVCCFCAHSSRRRRRLTVAFQKAWTQLAGASPFQATVGHGGRFHRRPGWARWAGCDPKKTKTKQKTANCWFFSDHQQTALARHKGLLVGRMTKVPRARAGSGTKQLKQAQRQPLCLSHIDTIIKPHRAQSRQAACVPR